MKDLMTDLHWEVFFPSLMTFFTFSLFELFLLLIWYHVFVGYLSILYMNVVISNFTNRLRFLIEFFV